MRRIASLSGLFDRFGDMPTVADALSFRAAEQPDAVAFRFLRHAGDPEVLTFGELEARTAAWASEVAGRTRPGDRVVLLFQPGLDFIGAFLACQRAGTIPVPMALPRLREPEERMGAILDNCRPAFVLSHKDARSSLARIGADVVETDGIDLTRAAENAARPAADLAFLQYTSGSTGLPKGVMVSHANVAANIRDIVDCFGCTADSRGVSWLPTYHDMGLIGCVLTPILLGAENMLMAPASFLRDPLRWLSAIAETGASISGGPNLAFDLCARRLADEATRPALQDLDLSGWRVAFTGAEPVRGAMLTRFAAAAAPYGFHPDSFLPCYGLAEATLFVTGGLGTPGRLIGRFDGAALSAGTAVAPEDGTRQVALVSCGSAAPGTDVAIVDPDTRSVLPDGRVGEIWAAGPGVAGGYWERPAESEAAFGNTLTGRTGRYLRTGDLGFLRAGSLFVSGRLRDLIIVNGLNHHPEDIEQTIAGHGPELAGGRAAVFSVEEEGGVRVLVAQEITREQRRSVDTGHIGDLVRTAVREGHGIAVAEVIVLSPGTLPLTSSGKVQRQRCREMYQSGELAGLTVAPQRKPVPAQHTPAGDALRLRAILAEVLGRDVEQVELQRPLSWYGLDSLKLMELNMLVQSRLGWELSGEMLYGDMTLTAIAEGSATRGGAGPGRFWMDTALPAGLKPASGTADGTGDVLVTGATGLVGTHIVRDLLHATERRILCLARGDGARLTAGLAALGVDAGTAGSRVEVIGGDVAEPRFGLAPDTFAALAERVGLVFHNAARLDFNAPYTALRAANVESARTVLELAAAGRPKLVAHTSSVSVLESPEHGRARLGEDTALDYPDTLAVGYAQSKWVADGLMLRARARGFAVSLFRPSWIVGPAGSAHAGDFVARFLEGCRRLGALPDSPYQWDLVPAGYVAQAIVRVMLAEGARTAVHHLGAARRLSGAGMAACLGRRGLPLDVLPVDAWRDRLRAAMEGDPDNPLRPLATLFLRDGRASPADAYLAGRIPAMDCRNTRARLRRLGVADPAPADSLLDSLLDAGRRMAGPLAAAAE